MKFRLLNNHDNKQFVHINDILLFKRGVALNNIFLQGWKIHAVSNDLNNIIQELL